MKKTFILNMYLDGMLKSLCCFLLLLLVPSLVISQRINTEFGKNRIQYHDDFSNWSKYETENFTTYYYGKSRNIAHSAIQMAEYDHDEIQKLLEHRMNDKIEIMVYTDLSDIKQSNLGTEEIFQNQKGQTKTVGKKMFVYFDGDHQHLRHQIRQGIASVYLNSIIQGSSVQEVVQNALLLNLPPWFKDGLVKFADESWNNEAHQELLHLMMSKDKYLNFEKLAAEHPEIAGHSMWYFLEQNYGRTRISQLIYITRIYRNLENSFSYVLYVPYEQIIKDWALFYIKLFDLDRFEYKEDGKNILTLKKKRKKTISQLAFSPDNNRLAYVTNEIGKQEIFIYDFKEKSTKRVFKNNCKNPFQTADKQYPLIEWHPNNRSLLIIYEKKDVPYLRKLDSVSEEFEEESIPESFQRIYSMDFINDNRILFSATNDGFSDLFFYKPKGRSTERVTEDIWDDLDAHYTKTENREGILFLSNRINDTLSRVKLDTIMPLLKKDIYFLDMSTEDYSLSKITNSPNKDESDLFIDDNARMVYLNSVPGTKYRNSKTLFSFESPIINSPQGVFIQKHTLSDDGTQYAFVDEDETNIYIQHLRNPDLNQSFTIQQNEKNNASTSEKTSTPKGETIIDEIPEELLFQSPFNDPSALEDFENISQDASSPDLPGTFEWNFNNSENRVHKFEVFRASAAGLKFKVFDFNTNFNNEPLFEGLESYSELDNELNNDPVGLLFRARIKDIFEDYSFEAGARYPVTLNGSEYYLMFDNNKKRWDKRYTIYRKNESNLISQETPFDRLRKHTLLGMARYKYPFDIFRSVRFTGSLRFDKTFVTSTSLPNHEEPFLHDKRLSVKAEYIYDNSFDVGINIKNGTRYKAYIEAINGFDIQLREPYTFDLDRGFTAIFGFDARHYIPILRKSVFALRAAGAGSIGSKQMLYYIGGTENWLLPQFDNSIPIPEGGQFAFKALAPNLRGFNHNIRNGGSFLVGNAEYRIPFVEMLFGKSVKRPILKNLQLVGFADAGMAWHGFSPYSDKNPLNTETIVKESSNGPDIIVLNVTYFRDPLVFGYGWGLRTTLLGYFVRLDIARGVESGIVNEPKFHFSLGYDF